MTYDQWKTDSGYGEPDEDQEPLPCVCGGTGWLDYDDEHTIPCTECQSEVTLEDLVDDDYFQP